MARPFIGSEQHCSDKTGECHSEQSNLTDTGALRSKESFVAIASRLEKCNMVGKGKEIPKDHV
jgi:hypothetical protein